MRITKGIVPIVLALTFTGLVFAKVPVTAAVSTIDFLDVDANKDGKVSLEEVAYIDDLRASFNALDVNHDQVLSPDEYSHWRRAGSQNRPNSH